MPADQQNTTSSATEYQNVPNAARTLYQNVGLGTNGEHQTDAKTLPDDAPPPVPKRSPLQRSSTLPTTSLATKVDESVTKSDSIKTSHSDDVGASRVEFARQKSPPPSAPPPPPLVMGPPGYSNQQTDVPNFQPFHVNHGTPGPGPFFGPMPHAGQGPFPTGPWQPPIPGMWPSFPPSYQVPSGEFPQCQMPVGTPMSSGLPYPGKILCHLGNIVAHRDQFVQGLSVL